jgi:hypothetical protein
LVLDTLSNDLKFTVNQQKKVDSEHLLGTCWSLSNACRWRNIKIWMGL